MSLPLSCLNNFQPYQEYYIITGSEEEEWENFYFQIRLNKICTHAELIHVEARKGISGTQVKQICTQIFNCIRPDSVILYDDSKVTHKNPTQDFYMRLFMPIVNENPKTWYSEDNFQILELSDDLTFEDQKVPYQSAAIYQKAVETIRSTKICTLPLYKGEVIPKQFLPYLSPDQLKHSKEITVHEIGKAIFQKLKNEGFKIQKTRKDFAFFYNNLLISNRIKNSPADYNEALNVLFNYKIWIKGQGTGT